LKEKLSFWEYVDFGKYVLVGNFLLKRPKQIANKQGMVMRKLTLFACSVIGVMGFMDWLTTTIGVSYFGASELNPFLSGIVHSNIAAFTAIKLTATALIALSFYLADYNIQKVKNQLALPVKLTRYTIKGANIGVVALLTITVLNNFVILSQGL
jgi:hypothetical protein